MYDCIIIGKGPAGISAALYTTRGKLNTLIVGGESKLNKAHKIDNYYGFPDGIDGNELLQNGEVQAKKLGAAVIEDTVLSIDFDGKRYSIITNNNTYETKTILLSTGHAINKVNIESVEKFEGKGIHYCVVCDGFFYNGKKVGILGYNDYGVHEAVELLNFSKDVTMYTNGNDLDISDQGRIKIEEKNIPINKKKIVKFDGENKLERIIFEDGEEPIEGLFVAYGSASSVDFARKLGILIDKDSIIVDKDYKTNVPGIFAAGDCTGGFKQISVAVGQGAIAGQKIVEYVRSI